MQSHYTSEMVETRLYEAGRALIALRVAGCWPAGYRSSMPEFVREVVESYGRGEADFRPSPPSARDISAMDQALSWVKLLPGHNSDQVRTRRLVCARMLCSPRSDRPLYSWRRLGEMLGVSHTSAKTTFLLAVSAITAELNRPGFCTRLGHARRDVDRAIGRALARPRRTRELA